MSTAQSQELINDLLYQAELGENDFPVITDWRGGAYNVSFPEKLGKGSTIMDADRLEKAMRGYRGLALEVNDHGNITVFKCFKNGNRRAIASRV